MQKHISMNHFPMVRTRENMNIYTCLSAFYPEDYLWYTANKSYGKWCRLRLVSISGTTKLIWIPFTNTKYTCSINKCKVLCLEIVSILSLFFSVLLRGGAKPSIFWLNITNEINLMYPIKEWSSCSLWLVVLFLVLHN